MSAQHTPGPWPIERKDQSSFIQAIGPLRVDEYAGSAWLEVSDEDARLIAAAPELLEALMETDKDLTVLLNNIYDAEQRDPKWAGMHQVVSAWRDRNRAAIAKATGGAA